MRISGCFNLDQLGPMDRGKYIAENMGTWMYTAIINFSEILCNHLRRI